MNTRLFTLAAALLSLPCGVTAQRPSVQSLIAQVKDSLMTGRATAIPYATLRATRLAITQADGAQSMARVDSVADGLVEAAIQSTGMGTGSIFATFVIASRPERGRPYSRAFDRLVEIYRRAPNPIARLGALSALGETNVARAMPIWRDVAITSKSFGEPMRAVELLCAYGGERGKQILREFHEQKSLSDLEARDHVAVMIKSNFELACPTIAELTGRGGEPGLSS